MEEVRLLMKVFKTIFFLYLMELMFQLKMGVK
jgi:hypothetical protein